MAISDWHDMMASTVTLEAVLTRDDYGKPATYDTAETYLAKLQYKAQKVNSRVTGADVVASGAVWLDELVTDLTVDMRLTLPDGTTPPIVSWDVAYDESGPHHTKIYFG